MVEFGITKGTGEVVSTIKEKKFEDRWGNPFNKTVLNTKFSGIYICSELEKAFIDIIT